MGIYKNLRNLYLIYVSIKLTCYNNYRTYIVCLVRFHFAFLMQRYHVFRIKITLWNLDTRKYKFQPVHASWTWKIFSSSSISGDCECLVRFFFEFKWFYQHWILSALLLSSLNTCIYYHSKKCIFHWKKNIIIVNNN